MQGNAPDEEHIDPHGECAARIHALEDALNRIANGCRLPVNEHQRVVLKVATEALGEAYKPFPMRIGS